MSPLQRVVWLGRVLALRPRAQSLLDIPRQHPHAPYINFTAPCEKRQPQEWRQQYCCSSAFQQGRGRGGGGGFKRTAIISCLSVPFDNRFPAVPNVQQMSGNAMNFCPRQGATHHFHQDIQAHRIHRMNSSVPDQLYKAVLVSSTPKKPTTKTVEDGKKGQS